LSFSPGVAFKERVLFSGGMHKGGLSKAFSIPSLWGEVAVFATVGGTFPAPASPLRGNEKGVKEISVSAVGGPSIAEGEFERV